MPNATSATPVSILSCAINSNQIQIGMKSYTEENGRYSHPYATAMILLDKNKNEKNKMLFLKMNL